MLSIEGNILDVKYGIICHQVNCKGKMGAGLALSIRKKWPIVYRDYMVAYKNHQLIPGAVILSVVDPNKLYIANLCGQLNYGRNGQYTIYKAVSLALSKMATFEREKFPVYIPRGMGCNLAGGDWGTMLAIIETTIPNAIIVNKVNS